jgi:hypothetical protein
LVVAAAALAFLSTLGIIGARAARGTIDALRGERWVGASAMAVTALVGQAVGSIV